MLAVIAVIAGFLILRAITDDDGDGGGPHADTASTPHDSLVDRHDVDAVDAVPGPTTLARSLTGATVSVANASGVAVRPPA